jgi:hypothetical protein
LLSLTVMHIFKKGNSFLESLDKETDELHTHSLWGFFTDMHRKCLNVSYTLVFDKGHNFFYVFFYSAQVVVVM